MFLFHIVVVLPVCQDVFYFMTEQFACKYFQFEDDNNNNNNLINRTYE